MKRDGELTSVYSGWLLLFTMAQKYCRQVHNVFES